MWAFWNSSHQSILTSFCLSPYDYLLIHMMRTNYTFLKEFRPWHFSMERFQADIYLHCGLGKKKCKQFLFFDKRIHVEVSGVSAIAFFHMALGKSRQALVILPVFRYTSGTAEGQSTDPPFWSIWVDLTPL